MENVLKLIFYDVKYIFISLNFYVYFFFTLLAYITIPKNRKQRKTLPEIKKISYNKYMDVKRNKA